MSSVSDTLDELFEMHSPDLSKSWMPPYYCNECGKSYPCPSRDLLNRLA